ncbi:hypothetical protein [Synechocystis sp. PCC 7509]|uniref:hypothetical protein n=1 Tax=Synechocystis sp. PCC 7509 TaxID=927677 RepID=UPI0002E9EFDF|nr:hypothetical protein [Synechocystis sp. PCC 7509]
MARTKRIKACDRCSLTVPILYRVKDRENGEWFFVCDSCLPTIKQSNPFYTYGGTWKAHKKSA